MLKRATAVAGSSMHMFLEAKTGILGGKGGYDYTLYDSPPVFQSNYGRRYAVQYFW